MCKIIGTENSLLEDNPEKDQHQKILSKNNNISLCSFSKKYL